MLTLMLPVTLSLMWCMLLSWWLPSQDDMWLYRAHAFGHCMATPQGQSTFNIPDHPLSLYEGQAGALCFIADLMNNPQGGGFPLFEL